jgi:hypothetical protein
MSEDDDVVDGEIKTPITFVVSGVSEENTYGGSGCQFVDSFGEKIRMAGTSKHMQVLLPSSEME